MSQTPQHPSEMGLKPCPYCKNEAIGGWFAIEYNIACVSEEDCPGKAGVSVYSQVEGDDDLCVEQAIFAWNTRPIEDAQSAEIARLKAILDRVRPRSHEVWCHNPEYPWSKCLCGYGEACDALKDLKGYEE